MRTPNPTVERYLAATVETLLLGYIKIAIVSLSLVRCVPIGPKSRWFFNGTIVCYQWWQIALIAFDIMVVVPFIFVLAWGAVKLHPGKVSAKHFLLASMLPLLFLIFWALRWVSLQVNVSMYKLKTVLLAPFREPEADKIGEVYWESIFIARRFILILLYSFITDSTLRLICMAIVCVLVLIHHTKMEQFQNYRANIAETASLLALVVLSIINLYKSFMRIRKKQSMMTGSIFFKH